MALLSNYNSFSVRKKLVIQCSLEVIFWSITIKLTELIGGYSHRSLTEYLVDVLMSTLISVSITNYKLIKQIFNSNGTRQPERN